MLALANAVLPLVVIGLFALVRDDTNMPVVTEKTFKGIDLAKLDAEFTAWVEAQKLPDEEAAIDDDLLGPEGGEVGGGEGDDGGN